MPNINKHPLILAVLLFFISCTSKLSLYEEDTTEAQDTQEQPISKGEAQTFIKKHQTEFFKADASKVLFHQENGVLFTSVNVKTIFYKHSANLHLCRNDKGEVMGFISSAYMVKGADIDPNKPFCGIKFIWTLDGKLFKMQYYAYGKRVKDAEEAKQFIKEINELDRHLLSIFPDHKNNPTKSDFADWSKNSGGILPEIVIRGKGSTGYKPNYHLSALDSLIQKTGLNIHRLWKEKQRDRNAYDDYYRQTEGTPCNGDPIPNPRIAPQKRSGLKGGMFNSCVRRYKDGRCKPHKGIDLLNPYGAPVYAMYDGKVYPTDYELSKAGWVAVLRAKVNVNGVQQEVKIQYFHLQQDNRKTGRVKAGDIIGYQGDSGNLKDVIYGENKTVDSHVHIKIEKLIGNKKVLVDPLPYLATKIDPKTGIITQPCK